MPKKLRPLISLLLLVAAIAAAVYYLAGHRSLISQLAHTPLSTSLTVLALYVVMFGVLLLIFAASVRICRQRLERRENSLLNAHSLLINFFVPGQGGPAYRGLYLYRRYKLRVKSYIIVTLLYYAVYAIISVCLLLAASRPWWQTFLAAMAVACAGVLAIRRYSKRVKLDKHSLELTVYTVGCLVLATLLQTAVQICIYAVELHSVNGHISLGQIVTYTGAANLALFVALTPGAIGIRESFLIFTRHLHHISSANIIVANVIDRSVYLVFLLLLIVATIGLHLKGKWRLKDLPALFKQSLSLPVSLSKGGYDDRNA